MAERAEKWCFASDNVAGICPQALDGLNRACSAIAAPYGEDGTTAQAAGLLRELFEIDCAVHFVFTGTAANALALGAMCDSYHSVVAHRQAHVETDECNAPEFFNQGLKIAGVTGARAKVDLQEVEAWLKRPRDVHFSPVGAVSIAQLTELGGLYSAAEIQQVAQLAHDAGAYLHMDGARFANAVAELGQSPAELSWRAGVDILCFGGTKQGMPATEAILIFDADLAKNFDYRVKQAGQLASKLRVLSAPWLGMLADQVWLRHARHANECARTLATAIAPLPEVVVLEPVHGNVLFVALPEPVAEMLYAAGWHFYKFMPQHYRLMCSWATEPAQIDAFAGALESALHVWRSSFERG